MCLCVSVCLCVRGYLGHGIPLSTQVLSLFPALIVDFLRIFAHFPQYLPAHFLRFMILAPRSPPADGCSGYKHFELSYFQLSHIYLISLGMGMGLGGGAALCCSFIKWHVSLCSYMYLSKSIFMRGLCCSCCYCCCCYCCFTSLNPNPPSSQSRKGRDQVQIVEYLRVHRMRYTTYSLPY